MNKAIFAIFIALFFNNSGAEVSDEEISKLYAKPSVFESIPKKRWIAESKNAYAIHDKYPQAPVHMLVIP